MTTLWNAYLIATAPFVAPVGEKWCVHSEHCCINHGCKYGDDDCPVWRGFKRQSYPCESCWMDAEYSDKRPSIPVVTEKTIKRRQSAMTFAQMLDDMTDMQ